MSRDHAIFAPSSAARWLNCPASAILAADAPERRSDEADEGTRVHKLIEQAVVNKSTAHVPPDDQWVVELALSFVAKLGPGQIAAERRVTISGDVWGTVDITHRTPCGQVATIADYKNGAMDVEAVDNKQMLTYAVGELREFPETQWFRFVIIQPNSRTHGDVEPIKQWVAPASTVAAHAREVERAVHRARRGEGPIPGKHCRYCPAFGECEATRNTLDLIKRAVEMPPSEIPDNAIAQIARVLRGLGDFHKLVDKELSARLLDGRPVKGATLDQGKAFRQWRDEFLAKKRLHELFGLDALSPLTPAQAEKLGSRASQIVAELAFKPAGAPKARY